jgi:ankyrin repeat protein
MGYDKVVRRLLKTGVRADLLDDSGKTALFYAADYDQGWVALTLLLGGADPGIAKGDGSYPLTTAARNGCATFVTAFVTAKLLVDHLGEEKKPNREDARAARIAKIDLDVQDAKGRTALMYAAGNGDDKMVDLLFNGGASTIVKDNDCKTAEDLARSAGFSAIADKIAIRD